MNVVEIPLSDPLLHRYALDFDANNTQSSSYRTDRGMEIILSTSYLPFNHYEHISQLRRQITDRPVEVLEGGCGLGRALRDLKQGIFFSGELSPAQEQAYFSERVRRWREGLVGSKLSGIPEGVHTTGITLSSVHRDAIRRGGYAHKIDHLIVGSLDDYAWDTKDRYDFIYDAFGPAMHSPLEAISCYSMLLRREGTADMRFLGESDYLGRCLNMLEAYGLEILDVGAPEHSKPNALEVLVKKN
jgi:hypothetical protein